MKRTITSILLAGIGLALVAGCTSRNLSMPTKAGPFVYESQRLGNKETIKEATFVGADGSSFTLRGFTSDQVEALGVVAESAARGAVQAMTGQGGGTAGLGQLGSVAGTSGGLGQLSTLAKGARTATAAPTSAENPLGAPVIVAGPDGRAYKLLVRNGVVMLAPTDEVTSGNERP